MVSRNISRTRNVAATLLTLAGISQIARLWFTNIDEIALVGALFGALYIITGIGLYGQSRFALFLAIVIPAGGAWLLLSQSPIEHYGELDRSQLGVALIVIILCARVLFAVRNNPST
jgi:uncharacterized membrane protein (DUF2068 family)